MKNLNEMNKAELRAECKVVGVTGYSKMDNAGMRVAIVQARDEVRYVKETGHTCCPHCNTHLSNGYWNSDTLVETHLHDGNKKEAVHFNQQATKEFWCMACDKFFGNDRTPLNLEPKARKAPETTGVKIEKNREERNGIKRPSIGGVCREVWDFCDAYLSSNGSAPKPAQMKAAATEKGWNQNNAVIELYRWKKFVA